MPVRIDALVWLVMLTDTLNSLSADSKKDMIDTLLNPALYQINNEISVVTLTAAVKVFAYFTAEAAEDWKLDLYNDAKDLVAKMMQTLSSCSSSPEVELQERVSRAFLCGSLC